MSVGKVCGVCKTENLPGAVQCQECGWLLGISDATIIVRNPLEIITRELRPYQGELKPGTLALRILGQREPMLVPIKDGIILGRTVSDAPQHLVDLSDHLAGLMGVSRQHAVIRPHKRGYTIEDLHSTNGTRLNTKRLPPGQPHTLESGDQVQLGELILFVSFASGD